MVKKIIFFVITFFALMSPGTINAADPKQAVLVNPIRGGDFWSHDFPITETPKKQYEQIKNNNFSATWLIRYDAIINPEVQDFLKNLDPSQDIGIFMEITPSLTNATGVKYNDTGNWHYAKSVLLTGYSLEDRKKLIDETFKKFKEVTGKDAKSVGAWWIDAGSLDYMKQTYGIEANLDVADQYSTDGYQVWGQYWSTPFYPSKSNALMPAQSEDRKLNIVTMQWATRDPFNGFGNGVFESTYSVQANDYMLHDLGTDYFSKLVDIYPQTTVGLENDFSWNDFGAEYTNQINVLKEKQSSGTLEVKSMLQFAQYYMKQNQKVSPNVLIIADDPLGSQGKVVWINTPKYRAAWFYNNEGSVIRDLRKFNDANEESCLKVACEELKLAFEAVHVIDNGNYASSWVLDEGIISDISINELPFGAEIKYKNQTGVERVIKFFENDIEVNGEINTFDVAITKAKTAGSSIAPEDQNFKSELLPGNINTILISAAKFLLLIIVFFLIPGFALTKRKLLAIPVGISIFTLSVWILGYFKLDFLIWALPIAAMAWILRTKRNITLKIPYTKHDLLVWLIIIPGSLSWMVTQFKNGLSFNYGLGFWGPNGHDAIWHLSLISELQKNVPPQNPIFAGQPLTNYHYFFDLLVAKSGALLNIDSIELLFRLFPMLFAILSGLLIYKVTESIFKSSKAALYSTFFLYFGGSFGWIMTYLKDGSIAGETMFWAQQSVSTLLNPPFAISVVIFLAGLLIFNQIKDLNQKPWSLIIALVLVWGSVIEFKAYAGVLVLGALGLYTLQRLILKKDWRIIFISLPILALSLIVFLPNNSGSESLIKFQPFWLIDSMVSSQDRLNWQRLTLTLESGVWYKLIYGYGLGILIFLVGNFGTRILSLAAFKEFFKQSFLAYLLILSIIFSLFFVQEGTAWNVVQFLYYGLLVSNIFAGIGLYNLTKNLPKPAALALVILVALLTIPTTWSTFQHYLPDRPPAKLSAKEYEALSFLKSQPEGSVFVMPYDEKMRSRFGTPLPLEVYTSTAYVSAFSGKPVFMEDTVNLEILGIDYKGRVNTVRDFTRNRNQSKQIMKENGVKYFYLPSIYNLQIDENQMGLKNIYQNEEVKIYEAI